MTVFPELRVFSWDIDEIASPIGQRHIPGGSFAFKHLVSLGCMTANPNRPATTSGTLIFEETKFDLTSTSSHLESKPAAITFMIVNSGVGVSNMKLYLVNDSALQGSVDEGLDRGFVQFIGSGNYWAYNGTLPSGAAPRMTTTVPITQNIHRQDGGNALVGNDDLNSSEFIYMNLVLPLGSPLGTYGVCGSGLLRMGLFFDYWPNDFILQFGDIG